MEVSVSELMITAEETRLAVHGREGFYVETAGLPGRPQVPTAPWEEAMNPRVS